MSCLYTASYSTPCSTAHLFFLSCIALHDLSDLKAGSSGYLGMVCINTGTSTGMGGEHPHVVTTDVTSTVMLEAQMSISSRIFCMRSSKVLRFSCS